MKKYLIFLVLFGGCHLMAQNLIEWRGPNRSGVFNETGLLKQWPPSGPTMLWSNEELPTGWSSMTIAHDCLYLTGRVDTMDAVVAVGLDGKTRWITPYGNYWEDSFPESRCTPTIDGNRLYVSSGGGDVACINALNGSIIWKIKAHQIFEGTFGYWGISESLIVLGDKVFYTPGGDKTTMVALNKMTGETIWMSESLHDKPAYVSPLLVQHGDYQLIVNLTENFVFGINPADGSILWQFDYGKYCDEDGKANIHANTPLYHKGEIFISNGYNHDAIMLKLADDNRSVSLKYVNKVLDVHHGGLLQIGDNIYGSSWKNNDMGSWVCLDWNSGETRFEQEWNNKGSIIAADGMLYCYDEKRGNLGLAKANPAQFQIISSFKIPLGKGAHWAHPVIHNKILYVRHGNALMAFDVAEK